MGRRKESGQAGQVSISSWEAGKADSHLNFFYIFAPESSTQNRIYSWEAGKPDSHMGGEDQERRSTTY